MAEIEIDDLDIFLGEMHNTIHAWIFAAGNDRSLERAEMIEAENRIRKMVAQLRLEVRQLKAIAAQPVTVADLATVLQLNPFCDLIGQADLMRQELYLLRAECAARKVVQ